MKRTFLYAALLIASGSASAGQYVEPGREPYVKVNDEVAGAIITTIRGEGYQCDKLYRVRLLTDGRQGWFVQCNGGMLDYELVNAGGWIKVCSGSYR